MTPAQLEHLKLIDAHLERLLAIAEKRTPGKWAHAHNVIQAEEFAEYLVSCNSHHTTEDQDGANAAFIASCAGNAEAGWRATRAAIAHILSGGHGHDNGEDLLAKSILAAFPLELIQKP